MFLKCCWVPYLFQRFIFVTYSTSGVNTVNNFFYLPDSNHFSFLFSTCLRSVKCFWYLLEGTNYYVTFLRGVRVTDDNGGGVGDGDYNVGYTGPGLVVMDILLFFNLAAILENMYILPLVSVFGACLRGCKLYMILT